MYSAQHIETDPKCWLPCKMEKKKKTDVIKGICRAWELEGRGPTPTIDCFRQRPFHVKRFQPF